MNLGRLSGIPLSLPVRIRVAAAIGRLLRIPRGRRTIAGLIAGRRLQRVGTHWVRGKGLLLFRVPYADPMFSDLILLGEYEPEVSSVIRRVVTPGDHVVDVGANFGWHTNLLASLVGPSGRVYAFDPVPLHCGQTTEATNRNGMQDRVQIHQVALGEREGEGTIHVFGGLTQGHASLSDFGRGDSKGMPCKVTTLDSVLPADQPVKLIKCDVEGAERAVFAGAQLRLARASRPWIVVESNYKTAEYFGYAPQELFHDLQRFGYRFAVIGRGGKCMEALAEEIPHGVNVLCSPSGRFPES